MKTYKNTLSIFLLLFLALNTYAGVELKKEFHESYSANENTNLFVSNEFGSVTINNTQKDEITIDVFVTIKSANSKRTEDIINQIKILIAKEGNDVTATTDFVQKSGWKKMTIAIDYVITMPSYVNTKLDVRYGGAYIDSITGHFDAKIGSSVLIANDLTCSDQGYVNSLELDYCFKMNVKSFNKMNLDLSYSDAKIGVGDRLNLKSKYSDVDLGDIAIVKADLNYSDLMLDCALDATVKGRYSDMEFGKINRRLKLETQYGDIEVDMLGDAFELVNIDAEYADVDIKIAQGIRCRVDITTSYGEFSVPKMYVDAVDTIDSGGKNRFVHGNIGEGNPSSKIQVNSSYGDVNIDKE